MHLREKIRASIFSFGIDTIGTAILYLLVLTGLDYKLETPGLRKKLLSFAEALNLIGRFSLYQTNSNVIKTIALDGIEISHQGFYLPVGINTSKYLQCLKAKQKNVLCLETPFLYLGS